MPDLSSISAVLSSLKSATDIAKIVRESGATLEQAEYKFKLAELVEKLADAKLQIAAIQDVIDDRDKKIKELEQASLVKGMISFRPPSYWITEGEAHDGPFCQQCYDSTSRLMRLTSSSDGRWICRTCRNAYLNVTPISRSFVAR